MYQAILTAHCCKISEALTVVGGTAELDFDTFRLTITGPGKYFEFVPEFAWGAGDYLKYESSITPEVEVFTGWRLVPRTDWDLTLDKLKFKNFCEHSGLRTPPLVADARVAGGAIVKEARRRAARGRILGPMAVDEALRIAAASGRELYAEKLIDGDTIRAWYWNGILACIERRPHPRVIGDGDLTVRALAEAKYPGRDWGLVEPAMSAMAKWQKLGIDAVPPRGAPVVLDFRFQSALYAIARSSENSLAEASGTSVAQQLVSAGLQLKNGVPENIRAQTLICVCGVIDAAQQVWFTDMDVGRLVHPDTYETTISNLFGISRLAHPVKALPSEGSPTRH